MLIKFKRKKLIKCRFKSIRNCNEYALIFENFYWSFVKLLSNRRVTRSLIKENTFIFGSMSQRMKKSIVCCFGPFLKIHFLNSRWCHSIEYFSLISQSIKIILTHNCLLFSTTLQLNSKVTTLTRIIFSYSMNETKKKRRARKQQLKLRAKVTQLSIEWKRSFYHFSRYW